jgi:hypothetical protein
MSQCLQDETLWLLSEGGGNEETRAHVANCAQCAARLQQLTSDLQVLSHVLQEAPPQVAVKRPRRAWAWRWISLATACAATLALVWSLDPLREPVPQRTSAASTMQNEEMANVLEQEVYSALFTDDGLEVTEFPSSLSTLTYVQAALDGNWPCERSQLLQRATCDQRPFFLAVED